MNIANLIGWIGNIFFIYGVYLLGKKDIKGFYSNTIGNLAYVTQGILLGMNSMFWLSVILIGLNIKGILEWGKENERL